jgi:putative molybdopterin biosynthesis protein
MAPSEPASAQPAIDNRLRERRQALGLSQKQLATLTGITRQAVAAVETNQYSPATSVALQLARALRCRVEDLFSLRHSGEIVEAELAHPARSAARNVRAQLMQIGGRLLARPLEGSGDLDSFSTAADGFIVGERSHGKRVKIQLATERARLQEKLVIAGCDPAMFLAAEHARRRGGAVIVPRLLGSGIALNELRRGHVHAAGVHLTAESSTDMRALKRRLLDRQLDRAGIPARRVTGYGNEARSHLDVARLVAAGVVDVGIGVRAAAKIHGVDFISLERERYDLIIPRIYYELPTLAVLLDTIVGQPFRSEIEAMGGYDTRDTGKIVPFM